MISLHPLRRSKVGRVQHLILPEAQEPFVGTIAEMTADPDPLQDFHIAECDGKVVGFFKIDRQFARTVDWLPPDATGMRGLLIGGQYQGLGYGRALLRALPDYTRATYPHAAEIWLSVDAANDVAIACYEKAGWQITGPGRTGRSGPEHTMRLQLAAPS